MKLDPEAIWVDLLEDRLVNGRPANKIFTRFLQKLVQTSKRTKISLGPKEYIKVRGINSAKTVRGEWKALRGMAKTKVLDPLVKAYPERRYLYIMTGKKGKKTDIPVWMITKVDALFRPRTRQMAANGPLNGLLIRYPN
jgi:hypothetical protein